MTAEAPPPSVLREFGVEETPVRLAGGRGRTWSVGTIVLKTVDDEHEATWIADLAASVEQRGFRLARPVAGHEGRWVVDGWSAWMRVIGEHSTTRWPELLAAAAAFHDAVAHVPKPEFIERRVDRWRIADRVVWGEVSAESLVGVTHLDELLAARRPLDLRSQLIHGDLVGNVLFADDLPPAIIDMSLYWRPVGYSAALVAGDALVWEGASVEILRLIEHFAGWSQLLLRAVAFRIVVNELARRTLPGRADLSEEYRRVVELLRSVVTKHG